MTTTTRNAEHRPATQQFEPCFPAYIEGVEAAQAGTAFLCNPYDRHTPEWWWWRLGYLDGRFGV